MLYIVALRKIPMSVALPCTAASYVVIALVGHFMFGESLGIAEDRGDRADLGRRGAAGDGLRAAG
jgi:hypothetical protein